METQKDFSINRYLGRWFEVARTKNPWESDCSFATADYSISDDFRPKSHGFLRDAENKYSIYRDNIITVRNTCLDQNGKPKRVSEGMARIPDRNDSSKLLVKFPENPVEGQYWVFYTDYDNFSFVGDERREFLWILSRKAEIKKRDIPFLLRKVREFGYNPDLVLVNTKLLN